MKRALITILLTLICATVVAGAARQSAIKVTLRPRVEVQPARTVVLKDVARIDGTHSIIKEIETIPIATGPMPGKSMYVESVEVLRRLRARTGIAIKMNGAQQVELVGKCVRLEPQELVDRARDFVVERLPTDGLDYEVMVDRAPREIVVAFGRETEIKLRALNPEIRPGPVAVAVDVVVDGRVVASTSVALTVKAKAEVLVATRTIKQGEALTLDNTTWDRRDVTKKPEAMIRSRTDLTSMVAARTLLPGELITTRDIASSFAIRRGDTVALTVTCGSVTLRTSAEAKQDARIGDTVRVRPAVSSEDIQAKVLGPGAVVITR